MLEGGSEALVKTRSARVIAVLLGAILLGVLAILLFGDDPVRPQFAQGQDKIEHVIAFASLSFLFALGGRVGDFRAAGASLVVAALGAEALQPVLTLTREASLEDAFAGALGVLMGLMAAACFNAAVLGRRAEAKAR